MRSPIRFGVAFKMAVTLVKVCNGTSQGLPRLR